MKTKHLLILAIAVFVAASCVSKKRKEHTLNLSGAFALYPLTIQWSEEYKKENPDVRFNISAGGAGKGMADALAGAVDLGMFSREILQSEKDQGVWWVGLCIDAVIPTISSDNPYLTLIKNRGLTANEFRAIFIDGTITNWNQILEIEESNEIRIYTRSDACGAASTWAKYIGGVQEDLKGIGVHGDPAIAVAVAKDPLSIGYDNTNYVYDIKTGLKREGMEVMPIDINENGVIDPGENFYDTFEDILEAVDKEIYPTAAARELYFVAKGKPTKQETLDFIKWTLTVGQKYVREAGYVPISQDKIDHYLKQLN